MTPEQLSDRTVRLAGPTEIIRNGSCRAVYEQYRDAVSVEYHKNTGYLHTFIPALLTA